jgi:glycerophosphoryl diester phosphodiesterase
MAGAATVRRWLRPRTWLLVGTVAVLAVAAVLLRQPLQEFTGTAPPPQFFAPLTPSPPATHRGVLGVAHNAGNNRATTQAALAHGAAVVEIDVVSVRGQPAAGRVQAWQWLAERLFRGPSLAAAWAYAAAAPVVKLDLQQNDPRLLQGLVTPAFVDWAHRQHLLVVAWTVNDGRRLGQLLALGVDGITTQNLAVLDALASH